MSALLFHFAIGIWLIGWGCLLASLVLRTAHGPRHSLLLFESREDS